MFRKVWMLVMVATVAAGCSVAKSSDRAEKEALERRVAELEQKLAEQQDHGEAAEAPALQPTPVPVRRETRRVVARATPEPRVETMPEREPVVERAAPVAVVPTPVPAPPLVIAEGTTMDVLLENALSSQTSSVGDRVVAKIVRTSAPDGSLVLPGGSYLDGRVTEVRESGRVKGKARVDVAFDRIVVRGQRYSIETTGLSFEADNSHKRDAAIVAGSAAAGAILGKITGGSAKKGAILGGAAGGGAVLATRGEEIEIPAGSSASVRVTRERVIAR